MGKHELRSACPKCGAMKFTAWKELSDDEKKIAERLPSTRDLNGDELKLLSVCTRCWNLCRDDRSRLA